MARRGIELEVARMIGGTFLVRPILFAVGVLILVVLFHLVDRIALSEQKARVTVRQKFYREARSTATYSTGGGVRITPQPEEWILKVEMNGMLFEASVPNELYDRVAPGDMGEIDFKQTRLTRRTTVTEFSRSFSNTPLDQ